MDKHHSKIRLVSEVGVGTTFWFDLEAYQVSKEAAIELDDDSNAQAA